MCPHTFLSLKEPAGADAMVPHSSSSLQLHTAAHTPPHD
jgi:hypothetical protein